MDGGRWMLANAIPIKSDIDRRKNIEIKFRKNPNPRICVENNGDGACKKVRIYRVEEEGPFGNLCRLYF